MTPAGVLAADNRIEDLELLELLFGETVLAAFLHRENLGIVGTPADSAFKQLLRLFDRLLIERCGVFKWVGA